MNAQHLIRLCRECAAGIYGVRAPSPRYAESVARLLIGTCATESHLVYRRQGGFSLQDPDGGWGLWQTQTNAMIDNLDYLRRRPDVRDSLSRFVFRDDGEFEALMTMGVHGLVRLAHDWDRFAVSMCRVHYLRFPAPVPEDLRGQAAYYKRTYNTGAGAGSVTKYIADWQRLVAPHLDG